MLAAPVHYLQAATCAFVLVAAAIAALVPTVHMARASAEPVVIAAKLTKSTSPSSPPTTTVAAPAWAPPHRGAAPVPAPTTTTTVPPPTTVALFGDSIADWLLRDAAPTFARTDVTLVDAAMEACDGAVDLPDARGRVGQILRPPPDCKEWTASYPPVVVNAALPVDVAVLVLGQAPILDRLVDGHWIGPCDDMSWYIADLEARITYLRPHVGDVVLAVPSWGGQKASFLSTDDHLARMGCIRTQLTAMATRLSLDTVDLASVLCPAGPDGACTSLRDRDGTHVDPEDAPYVLDWLLDSILRRR